MAGLVLVVCWGLAVRVTVGFNTNVHAAPLDHHAIVICWFNRASESQIRKTSGATLIVLAIYPFAFEGLGLKLG